MAKSGLRALSILLLFVSAPGTARGEDRVRSVIHELKGGILAHDVDNLWSGFSREGGVDINLEIIFSPSADLLGGTLRPALGTSINTGGDTSKIYVDARWEYELEFGAYLAFGLGIAAHNGEQELVRNDRKALGSSVLFHFPIEIGYRFDGNNGVSVYFDHVSNGYLVNENEGLDTIGLRYGYRF